MSAIALWLGLTCILAVPELLKVLGLGGGNVFVLVGAVLMVVGVILLLTRN